MLLGLPWLASVCAVRDYGNETLSIRNEDGALVYENWRELPSMERSIWLSSIVRDADAEASDVKDLPGTFGGSDRARTVFAAVTIGTDLIQGHQKRVEAPVLWKHQAWALSLSEEVGAIVHEHRLVIDPDIRLPTKPRVQKLSQQMKEAVTEQLHILREAGIIRAADVSEIKCVLDIVMAPKKSATSGKDQQLMRRMVEDAVEALLGGP